MIGWVASGIASLLVWMGLLVFRTQSSGDFTSLPMTLSADPHYSGGYPAPMILGYVITVVLLGWAASSFGFAIRASRRSRRRP